MIKYSPDIRFPFIKRKELCDENLQCFYGMKYATLKGKLYWWEENTLDLSNKKTPKLATNTLVVKSVI